METPILQLQPTTIHVPGKALGRNRLLNWHQFAHLTRDDGTPIVTTGWDTNLPTCLNQLKLGSCTGNAWAHIASSKPNTDKCTEANAVAIYSKATVLDDAGGIVGHYPPDDTGSTGYFAALAAIQLGFLNGTPTMPVGLTAVLQLLQSRPGAIGMDWYEGCDNPDGNGRVKLTGSIRGGHEIALIAVDMENRMVVFQNSWGAEYGVKYRNRDGCFMMSLDDLELLFASGADAVFI